MEAGLIGIKCICKYFMIAIAKYGSFWYNKDTVFMKGNYANE